MSDSDSVVARLYITESRATLKQAYAKIVHCLEQLNDDQVNWRPFEQQNSLANIVLHLCGNLRQWVIAGVEKLPDTRHRPSEFSDRARYTRADLLARLAQVVNETDATLSRVTAERLLEPRRIQAFDTNVLASITKSVSHFVGHSQEVIYITRLQLKESYKFKFVPETKEQGSP